MTPPSLRIEAVELGIILPLRTDVLRDGQPAASALFPGEDASDTIHLAARDPQDAVVGCVTVIRHGMPEDAAWTHQLRGMAVAENRRGRGIGGQLLNAMARLTPHEKLWCNARVPAQCFYERHGWVAASPVFVVPHHGPHLRMTRGQTSV